MSILGYSAAYFLPSYWAKTPLYGEKLIPLLDYILSTDYTKTEQLATAFYNIQSKYKNTADLPTSQIEEIINESGYTYIRNLLGQDEESLKLLVYLLVMVHQLKGSKKGVETVLNLLKTSESSSTVKIVGSLERTEANVISGFTLTDYAIWSGASLKGTSLELAFKVTTGTDFQNEQCIASSPDYGFYLGTDVAGRLVLKIGQRDSSISQRSWQEIDGTTEFVSERSLDVNTTYYILLEYDGYEYSLRVSTDGIKYFYYNNVLSTTPINSINGMIYLGIDSSEGTLKFPFQGSIFLSPLTIASSGISIQQWFETLPVGKENTFTIESTLDGDLISADFFEKFARFIENYVYPSLRAFKAKLSMKIQVTFIPYVRSVVTYIASDSLAMRHGFFVKDGNTHIPYEVKIEEDSELYENYQVLLE